MNRLGLIIQVTAVALLLSTAAATAFRHGGRLQLWVVGAAALGLLEVLTVWSWNASRNEGPLWLTALALVPPAFFLILVVDVLARRHTRMVVQISVGTVVGLAGYVLTALLAYVIYMSL